MSVGDNKRLSKAMLERELRRQRQQARKLRLRHLP
jgi:hypothetical protein